MFKSSQTVLCCVVTCAVFVSGTALQAGEPLKTGTVTTRTFTGPISGDKITLDVYTPEGYRSGGRRYPVIYNIHGRGGAYNRGDPVNFRKAMVDAISRGILPPVIAVYPDGTRNGWYADSKDKKILIETHIIREIIPWVDSEYGTKASKQYRVIQGMSMGGYGASLYAVKFPELFSICINYDGAMWNWDNMTVTSGKWDAVAPVMFDSDEDYYDQNSSPWSIAVRNKDRIAGKVVFRAIEGSLGKWLRPWRDHLKAQGIEMDYVLTTCSHNLVCLHEQAGEDSFRLIAEQFSKTASTGKP